MTRQKFYYILILVAKGQYLPDSHVQLLTGAKRRFKPVYNQTSSVQLLTRTDYKIYQTMKRFAHYTTSDHEILYTLSLALLKKHNIQFNKKQTRLLTKEEEGFIAGCKGNINYGGQKQLSGKQLKRLEVLLKRFIYKLDTLQKIKLKMVVNKEKK